MPDGKCNIDGFLCVFDVSIVPNRTLEKQVEILNIIIVNIILTITMVNITPLTITMVRKTRRHSALLPSTAALLSITPSSTTRSGEASRSTR